MIDINNITILVGLATLIWSVWKYYDSKKRDQNLREFENYHRLIKELVQPENEELYIDRQTSIMYELRHFKRYYPISLRTMNGLYEKWKKVPDQFPRLLEEIEMTIKFLEKKNKI